MRDNAQLIWFAMGRMLNAEKEKNHTCSQNKKDVYQVE